MKPHTLSPFFFCRVPNRRQQTCSRLYPVKRPCLLYFKEPVCAVKIPLAAEVWPARKRPLDQREDVLRQTLYQGCVATWEKSELRNELLRKRHWSGAEDETISLLVEGTMEANGGWTLLLPAYGYPLLWRAGADNGRKDNSHLKSAPTGHCRWSTDDWKFFFVEARTLQLSSSSIQVSVSSTSILFSCSSEEKLKHFHDAFFH